MEDQIKNLLLLCLILIITKLISSHFDGSRLVPNDEMNEEIKTKAGEMALSDMEEFFWNPQERSSLATSFAKNVTKEARIFNMYFDSVRLFVSQFDVLYDHHHRNNLENLMDETPLRYISQIKDSMAVFLGATLWCRFRADLLSSLPETEDQTKYLNDVAMDADIITSRITKDLVKRFIVPVADILALSMKENVDIDDIKERAKEIDRFLETSNIKLLVDDLVLKVNNLPKLF